MYISPEILKKVDYGNKVDVWSSGVVTYVLLSGRPPFFGQNQDACYRSILDDKLSFEDDEIWNDVSDTAKDFLKKALQKNPDDRLSSQDALNHPWLSNTNNRGVSERKLNKVC